jgi:hypothetical protein
MEWELWVDYHRIDADGLTHAHQRNTVAGARIEPGTHVVVGNEDADPAVALVVSVEQNGAVLLRILPGPAEAHLALIQPRPSTTSN